MYNPAQEGIDAVKLEDLNRLKIQMAKDSVEFTKKELIENLEWCVRNLEREIWNLKNEDRVDTFLPTNLLSNLAPKHANFLAAAAVVKFANAKP